MSRDKALEIFNILSGMNYGCTIKHLQGVFSVEVPVTLRGDPAYGKQAEIIRLAMRGGFEPVQAGQLLRIV